MAATIYIKNAKNRIRRSRSETVTMLVSFVVFFLYAASLIFPFLWLLNNSLKTNQEFFGNVWSLPKDWLFTNYVQVLKLKVNNTSFFGLIVNSLLYVAVNTFTSVFIPSMTAYIIAKYDFKLKNVYYSVAIFIMVIPTLGGVAAMFKLLKTLGIYNSYLSLFLMNAGGFGMGFLLLYGFFKNLSKTYAEAALVDGAEDFRVYFQIMLPQAKPVLLSWGVLSIIAYWNDYFGIYMYAPKSPNLAVGIKQYLDAIRFDANYPQLFAVMLISILPVLIAFGIFNDTIMKSTVAGGLKG
jgi:raffinose/stachyose/melibiose transport system permease protein/N-acetylglucosamine transport system permease protein